MKTKTNPNCTTTQQVTKDIKLIKSGVEEKAVVGQKVVPL
jgi:hypothetical protein